MPFAAEFGTRGSSHYTKQIFPTRAEAEEWITEKYRAFGERHPAARPQPTLVRKAHQNEYRGESGCGEHEFPLEYLSGEMY